MNIIETISYWNIFPLLQLNLLWNANKPECMKRTLIQFSKICAYLYTGDAFFSLLFMSNLDEENKSLGMCIASR